MNGDRSADRQQNACLVEWWQMSTEFVTELFKYNYMRIMCMSS